MNPSNLAKSVKFLVVLNRSNVLKYHSLGQRLTGTLMRDVAINLETHKDRKDSIIDSNLPTIVVICRDAQQEVYP